MKEKERRTASGFVYLALLALIAIGLVAGFIITARQANETGARGARYVRSCSRSTCCA